MVDPVSSPFWKTALESRLIGEQQLHACWDSLPVDKKTEEALDRRLARRAIELGFLTTWQARQLLAGRSTGFVIDRYLLLELLGHGGMGRVFLARDQRLKRKVAVKVLLSKFMVNPVAVARFRREVKIGAQLEHENLVRFYDEGEVGGRLYIVMEYIEGKSIAQFLTQYGPIPHATAAGLARQVALGLEHARRKHLIHRDVNPGNILVSPDGVAKLTDLGLALNLLEADALTRDGTAVGTLDYMSPEQARHSRKLDTRTDVYSLGCTLYHMVTGVVPFNAPTLPEKILAHMLFEPATPSSINPEIPIDLSLVIAKMMHKSPDGRYATPEEVAFALEPFVPQESKNSQRYRINRWPELALSDTSKTVQLDYPHQARELIQGRPATSHGTDDHPVAALEGSRSGDWLVDLSSDRVMAAISSNDDHSGGSGVSWQRLQSTWSWISEIPRRPYDRVSMVLWVISAIAILILAAFLASS